MVISSDKVSVFSSGSVVAGFFASGSVGSFVSGSVGEFGSGIVGSEGGKIKSFGILKSMQIPFGSCRQFVPGKEADLRPGSFASLLERFTPTIDIVLIGFADAMLHGMKRQPSNP
jgi:hypothetical protein